MRFHLMLLLAATALSSAANADVKTNLEAAMAGDTRSEAEIARDDNRRPAETLLS